MTTEKVPSAAEPERRRQARLPVNQTRGRLLAHGARAGLWARILDVSTNGLGLLLTQRLEPGTRFQFEWKGRQSQRFGMVRGRVVHVAEVDQGTFRTGSSLESPLRRSDLEALLE